MPLAGIVTLVGVALTVAALALYLISVIVHLRHTSFTLGTIIAGLRSIAHQTRPVGVIVNQINADLEAVKGVLEGALGVPLTGELIEEDEAEVAVIREHVAKRSGRRVAEPVDV